VNNISCAYLGCPGIFEVPELDMAVSHGDEVIPVLRKRHRLHFAGHLIGGHFYIAPPIPDVDYHVMLRADGHHVFVGR